MEKSKQPIGAHLSIAGGFENIFKQATQTDCTAIQIFTKSGRSWNAKPITNKEIQIFNQVKKETPSVITIVAHAGYLINLAAQDPEIEKKSINSLILELQRCDELSLDGLVLHPGSHVGQGESTGLKKIINNINHIFATHSIKTPLLLETAAGQGTNLGYTFEQLHTLLMGITKKSHIGICLDTCHIFSAGYDISTPKQYEKIIMSFDKIIGLQHLRLIHLNDSKYECGAKLDRHENLGKGKIPLTTFSCIINDTKLIKIPKILETPIIKESLEYAAEINLLRSMAH